MPNYRYFSPLTMAPPEAIRKRSAEQFRVQAEGFVMEHEAKRQQEAQQLAQEQAMREQQAAMEQAQRDQSAAMFRQQAEALAESQVIQPQREANAARFREAAMGAVKEFQGLAGGLKQAGKELFNQPDNGESPTGPQPVQMAETEEQKVDRIMKERGLPSGDPALRSRIIVEVRKTGTVPESFKRSGDIFSSVLPNAVFEPVGDVPKFGKSLENVARGVTSPVGLATLPIGGVSGTAAKALGTSLAGSVLGGTAAAEIGGEKARVWGELGGGVGGAIAPAAAGRAGRALEESVGTRLPGAAGTRLTERALERRGVPGIAGAADPIDVFDDVLPNEKPSRAALRAYEGRTGRGGLELLDELDRGDQMLSQSGLGAVVQNPAKPTEETVALFKALHGEGPVPPRLQAVYDDLKSMLSVEEAATLDFDPKFMAHPDYFPRGWRAPEQTNLGARKVASTPGFAKPRSDASFTEMLDAGWQPASWNPYQMYALRRIAGTEFREQVKLIDRLKATGVAVSVDGPTPTGWRTPQVGPAFEGKPYASAEGRVGFTPRVIVPDAIAGRLENMFGTPADWGHLGTVDIRQAIMKTGQGLKRAKLMGGLFQQADFSGRSSFAAFGGAADDLLHGRPISAANKIVKLPATIGKMVWSNVSSGRRAALRRQMLSTEPFVVERPGLSPRSVLDAGWQTRDTSAIRSDIRATIEEAGKSPPSGVKVPLGVVKRRVNQLNKAIERGMYEGLYPQAQIEALRNFIVPRLVRAHPDWTDAQLAASAADEVNKMFSTLGTYQTVLGSNRTLSDVAHSLIFSTNEAEALIKQALSTIAGPNKALWIEYYLGGALFLAGVANAVNFAATGEPLDFKKYNPINKSSSSPFGIDYNSSFLSPEVPRIKGRGGFPVEVDLMMQMDTVLRLLDPVNWIQARENVGPRAIANQLKGKDFYGRPLEGPLDRVSQAVSDLAVPIPGQNIGGIIREKVPGADKFIPEGESRLGPAGLGVQIGGVNLRAQSNRDLLDQSAREWAEANGVPGVSGMNDLAADQRAAVRAQGNVNTELEKRQATSAERGNKFSQYELAREEMTGSFRATQESDDQKLEAGTMTPETWRGRREDRLAERSTRSEQLAKDMGIDFESKDAKIAFDKAINNYYSVTSDKYTNPETGEVDWPRFFDDRDAALAVLSPEERQRFDAYTARNLTPTEKRFKAVQDIHRKYYDLPKYKGLSIEEGEQLDQLKQAIGLLQTEKPNMSDGIALSRLRKDFDAKIVTYYRRYYGARSPYAMGKRPDPQDPARDKYLLANLDLLRFYPELGRSLSNEQKRKLPRDILLGLYSPEVAGLAR